MQRLTIGLLVALSLSAAGCARKQPVETITAADSGGADRSSEASEVGLIELPQKQAELVVAAGSDTIYFGTDRFDLDAEDRQILSRQAEWLRANPALRVSVEGHADERGTREYNQALGERRAHAARDYLISQGVSPARLMVVSWGKERPVDPGSGEQAWARNRRAVSILVQ